MIMKLSNIFLSTLAVLLCCTACSKDDESFKGKDADASLSIAVKAAGSAVTKGFHPNDENELAGEAKVNNLSVLVFEKMVHSLSATAGRQPTRKARPLS